MEQAHLCYLKDKDKFFDAIASCPFPNGMKRNSFEKSSLIADLEQNYKKAYENIPPKDITKQSNIIDEYMENVRNYKDPGVVKRKEYLEQILEKDAHQAEKAGSKFLWLDKPILYIPKNPLLYGLAAASLGCFVKNKYNSDTKNT